jgi:hypothetical protein
LGAPAGGRNGSIGAVKIRHLSIRFRHLLDQVMNLEQDRAVRADSE